MADIGQFFRPGLPEELIEGWQPKRIVASVAGGPIRRFLARLRLRGRTTADLVDAIGKHPPRDVVDHQRKVAEADAQLPNAPR